jgi:TatD DNase family protein
MAFELVDTHCHLPDSDFDADREQVLARAREAGVTRVLAVGTSPADWGRYLAVAGAALSLAAGDRVDIRAALGVHPNSAKAFTPAALAELRRLIGEHRGLIAAVGEIGLDFHRQHATPEEQRPAFQAQLDLAAELDLPVVLHCREAEREMLAVLRAHRERLGGPLKGVWHSFSATAAEARAAEELGLHLAFNGILTYPKAEGVRSAARGVSPARLLVETDAPYLPPQPWRGKRNEPAYVAETARRLAQERGVAFEELARVTTENARRLLAW